MRPFNFATRFVSSCLSFFAWILTPLPGTGQIIHDVQVQNNFFSPATLTIDAGDTVRFHNFGGGSHNVRADNDAFRCANGCDGQGGNGNPSTENWTATITFGTPGDIPFYCEIHGAPGGLGMAGVISVTGALSVDITDFEAVADGAAVLLRWETAHEKDNAGYRIEHRTTDTDFRLMAFVAGAGTSETPQRYRHRIDGLAPGHHYFRLQQIAFDGHMTPSPVAEVVLDTPGPFTLSAAFPNPFSDLAHIDFSLARDQTAHVFVYDVRGRRVAVLHEGSLAAGTHRFTFDAGDLPAGLYGIRVQSASFTAERSIMRVQ